MLCYAMVNIFEFIFAADGMATILVPCHQLQQNYILSQYFVSCEYHFKNVCPAWSLSESDLHKLTLISMLVKETTGVWDVIFAR